MHQLVYTHVTLEFGQLTNKILRISVWSDVCKATKRNQSQFWPSLHEKFLSKSLT